MKVAILQTLAVGLVLCLFGGGTLAAADSQSNSEPQVLGTVTKGDTTIIFEAANKSDLNTHNYQLWEHFADQHPDVVKQISKNPGLAHNQDWIEKHVALTHLLAHHPELARSFYNDPGNYVAPAHPGVR